MKSAIEIYCRLCHAQKFEMCKNPDGSTAPRTHWQRFEDAEASSSLSPCCPQLSDALADSSGQA